LSSLEDPCEQLKLALSKAQFDVEMYILGIGDLPETDKDRLFHFPNGLILCIYDEFSFEGEFYHYFGTCQGNSPLWNDMQKGKVTLPVFQVLCEKAFQEIWPDAPDFVFEGMNTKGVLHWRFKHEPKEQSCTSCSSPLDLSLKTFEIIAL
jgi:hypothetical protein